MLTLSGICISPFLLSSLRTPLQRTWKETTKFFKPSSGCVHLSLCARWPYIHLSLYTLTTVYITAFTPVCVSLSLYIQDEITDESYGFQLTRIWWQGWRGGVDVPPLLYPWGKCRMSQSRKLESCCCISTNPYTALPSHRSPKLQPDMLQWGMLIAGPNNLWIWAGQSCI